MIALEPFHQAESFASNSPIPLVEPDPDSVAETELVGNFAEKLACIPSVGTGWETPACRALCMIDSIDSLKQILEKGPRNQRLMACFVLGLVEVSESATQLAIEILLPFSDEWTVVNEYTYGRFQCEDEEPRMTLGDTVAQALRRLKS